MTLEERFWQYVDQESNNGCWLWSGATQKGYGALVTGSRLDGSRHMVRTHRLSWTMHRGEIPNGMLVCHTCDVKRCVNPDHLYLGNHQDNIRDAIQRDRWEPWQSAKTHCVRGHELDGENLRWTAGKRRCRECSRLRTAERRKRIGQ